MTAHTLTYPAGRIYHSRLMSGSQTPRPHLAQSQPIHPKTTRGPPSRMGKYPLSRIQRPSHHVGEALQTPHLTRSNFQTPPYQWLSSTMSCRRTLRDPLLTLIR